MKILILNHNDQGAGTYFRCLFLGKSLSKLGNEVSLSCLNPKHFSKKVKNETIEGVNLFLLTGQHGNSSFSEFPFHIIRVFENIKIALAGRFDVIYFFNVASLTTGLPLIFLYLLRTLGVIKGRFLVDCDDWWGKDGLTSLNRKGRLIVTTATLLETKLPKLAEKVTVVSGMIKNKLISSGIPAEKIYYLPNGAEINGSYSTSTISYRLELNLPTDKIFLCFVGRALWTFDYLLEGLKLVVRERPETMIIYISPLGKELIEKLRRSGILNNIICLGTQSNARMQKYLRAADILLLPRIESINEKANYPGRLGDYLAAGRPIVSTAIGDEAEKVIRKFRCGLLSKSGEPADFSKNIIKLIDDRKLREKFGQNNRQVAEEKMSWDIITREFWKNVILEDKKREQHKKRLSNK